MKQRILTGAMIAFVLLLVIIFSSTPFFPFVISVCSVIGVFEMVRCIGLKKAYSLNIPLYLLALIYPYMNYYISDADFLRKFNFIVIVTVPLYFFTMMTFSHGKYKLTDVSVLFTTVFYIILGFNAIILMYNHRGEAGPVLCLTILIGAWITDVFAYFCGVLFGRDGKHKLLPDVSPKKTVEGSIGGIVFCTLFMTLFGWVCGLLIPNLNAYLGVFVIGGIVASIVAQIGDLLMSVIKRSYGIKDYGNIFPGHGGVLDRCDSILSVAIVMAAFSSFFNFFEVI
ncbi:MAG: phosphatidate cytidylyltransferase [Clostridia bacterium]|nr:phosphatidate cytidylyltransferase [Clostridia bacterium]